MKLISMLLPMLWVLRASLALGAQRPVAPEQAPSPDAAFRQAESVVIGSIDSEPRLQTIERVRLGDEGAERVEVDVVVATLAVEELLAGQPVQATIELIVERRVGGLVLPAVGQRIALGVARVRGARDGYVIVHEQLLLAGEAKALRSRVAAARLGAHSLGQDDDDDAAMEADALDATAAPSDLAAVATDPEARGLQMPPPIAMAVDYGDAQPLASGPRKVDTTQRTEAQAAASTLAAARVKLERSGAFGTFRERSRPAVSESTGGPGQDVFTPIAIAAILLMLLFGSWRWRPR